MKDYKNIYRSGSSKADSLIKEASSASKEAKIRNKNLEKINALVALQVAERKKFKNFENRYEKLKESPRMKAIFDGREMNTAREVYDSGKINISEGINMNFDELEALIALNELEKKNINLGFVKKLVGREEDE